nr:hypothetical protein [Pandoraea sp.]
MKAARFNFGQVEDVVDHAQQGFEGRSNGRDQCALRRRHRRCFEQLEITQRPMQGGAQLMTGRGQKYRLGLAGFVGFLLGLSQQVFAKLACADVVDAAQQDIFVLIARSPHGDQKVKWRAVVSSGRNFAMHDLVVRSRPSVAPMRPIGLEQAFCKGVGLARQSRIILRKAVAENHRTAVDIEHAEADGRGSHHDAIELFALRDADGLEVNRSKYTAVKEYGKTP